jgi:hypothetical protein
MNAFFFFILLAGPTDVPGTKLQSPTEQPRDTSGTAIVLADGAPGWPSQQADKILGELNALLDSSPALQVARYDAEPMSEHCYDVRGASRDLVMVRPRTPMRDAMEMGFALLMESPRPHTMVVIANEQFYPTSVLASRLLKLAQRSEARVHTILLASSPDQARGSVRLGQHVINGAVWVVERIALRQRAYSVRDTSRFLKAMSDATGGTFCVADDERTGMACADAIATIMGREYSH